MKRIKNGNYKTPNKFGDFTALVNEYLNKVYGRSLELYTKRYANTNPTGTPRIDIEKIEESLGYIDDYLYYYYQFYNESFVSIFKNLINNLQFVTVFPPDMRGLFGEYSSFEKTLYINPKLTASSKLSADERTRLYICHELGHIQNSIWMEKLIPILNGLNISGGDRQLIYDGFSLLDEATAQDRAENITYYYCSRLRPFMYRCSTDLFDGSPFETNFDYYGEFQVPAISFAKTLRGIGNLSDDESVMEEFDGRSLSEDFSTKIIDEYTMDGQINNLYYMLKRLGIIKNAAYAVFGLSDQAYLQQSLMALREYNHLVKRMRDYRDPIVR